MSRIPLARRTPASYEISMVKLSEMSEDVINEAKILLREPWLTESVLNCFPQIGITGENELAMTLYLVGTSRLLKRPLAAIVQGPSSSGKSFAIERVASLFPEETIYDAGQLTPNALVYEQESLRHRFVVAGERSHKTGSEGADSTRMLRELLSSGRVTKRATVTGPDGSRTTEEFHCEGPIAYVESTTLAEIFDEDANRCLLLQTNETSQQTRNILSNIADTYASQECGRDAEDMILLHHAIQRLIRPQKVTIPFARSLAQLLPADRMEIRRIGASLFRMIETVTLLNQYQRETVNGALVSTDEDYEMARRLMNGPTSRFIGTRLSPAAERFLERLRQRYGMEHFSTRDCKQSEEFSERAVQGWLSELHEGGHIKIVEASRSRMPAIWQVTQSGDRSSWSLPDIDEIRSVQERNAA